ncbi:MAG TPA: NAD(P)H-hydrate dehydratase [Candidatus Kurthia intestinigallinarum]|nr:NAD(P)H-hydrate dehydratase [Candidatus Kurthia intestinigallinarum]
MYALTTAQMQALERYTIETIGIDGGTLMEIAGNAVVMALREHELLTHERIAIVCGTGNNGGDGFVIARRLIDLGYDVRIGLAVEEQQLRGDAKTQYHILKRRGIPVTLLIEEVQTTAWLASCAVLIDCLLGTGASGALRGHMTWLIPLINALEKMVVAIDLPSGLHANSGEVVDAAIEADYTLTLAQPKIGCYLQQASHYIGELIVVDISVPETLVDTLHMTAPTIVTPALVKAALPARPLDGHKGTFGHGAVIGGSQHYVGAPLYSAKAAFHSGIGLISLIVPEGLMPSMMLQAPEVLLKSAASEDGYMTKEGVALHDFTKIRAVAFGPGLGRAAQLQEVAAWLLALEGPETIIVDADGLYMMKPLLQHVRATGKCVILTPHPGEMAMLCDTTIAEIEQHRFSYARDLAQKFGVYVLLKGHRSIVATPDGAQWLIPIGSSALGKGGSGDVLTGLILSFVTQRVPAEQALYTAAYLQAETAEKLAAQHSHYSVTPEMVVTHLGQLIACFVK